MALPRPAPADDRAAARDLAFFDASTYAPHTGRSLATADDRMVRARGVRVTEV